MRRVRFQLDAAPPEGSLGARELRALDGKIQELREQLRAALARRSELAAALGTAKSSRGASPPPAAEEPPEER